MTTKTASKATAFSLIEMLMVIAIISVMSGLVISKFTNATSDTRGVLARQQQAAVQSAVMNYISQAINSNESTVAVVRQNYNVDSTSTSDRSSKGRLTMVKDYLDAGTYEHFITHTSDDDKLKSAAMKKLNMHLVLSEWASPTATNKAPYPKVELKND